MRKAPLAAWLACVVALATMLVSSLAAAQKKPKKNVRAISSCVKYDRTMAEDGLSMSLDNTCNLDVECTLSWTLRCDEGGEHAAAASVDIGSKDTASAFASASQCGDDGWRISTVKWSCQASDD